MSENEAKRVTVQVQTFRCGLITALEKSLCSHVKQRTIVKDPPGPYVQTFRKNSNRFHKARTDTSGTVVNLAVRNINIKSGKH